MEKLIIATRSSPLALWQANEVAAKLQSAGIPTELKSIETIGDKKLDVTLSKIGDKGVFTLELEDMLLKGEAHIAVHSAKDMPSNLPTGLQIIAFTEREKPFDVLVSENPELRLKNKPLLIGTSSTRRVATLKRHFPEIEPIAIRGNLQTRIRKMREGQCDGLLLAYAGIFRMGYSDLIRQNLDLEIFTPSVGQGALAIEISETLFPAMKLRLQSLLQDPVTALAINAERSFLRTMEGGCSVPVFGYSTFENGILTITGGIISLDGKDELRKIKSSQITVFQIDKAIILGKELAEEVLNEGGDSILSKIKQNLHP
jgi:hydroxymethylbilane synthase